MPVTPSPRWGFTFWSAGTDPLTRAQLQADHERLDEILYPAYSTAQRDALAAADRPPGYIIFNTTTTTVQVRNAAGDAWVDVGSQTRTLTTAARDALSAAERPPGTLILNTTTGLLEVRNAAGSAWAAVAEDVTLSGTFANRPAAGTQGRFYEATDTGKLYYDDGTTWDEVAIGDLTGGLATKLALAGGTMSGTLNMADQIIQRALLLDYAESTVINAAAGATPSINYEAGTVHDLTLDVNAVLSVTNPPASGATGSLLIFIRQPAVLKSLTWPASFKWPAATAPIMAINTVNIFAFATRDAGVNWLNLGSQLDVR